MADEGTRQAAAELAAAVAEQLLGEGWLPPSGPLPEWCCPACGATTRARLADKVALSVQVFLPGDTLPPGVAIINTAGVLYGHAPGWVVSVPGVEIPLPTAAQVRALVDQEVDARAADVA